METLDERVSVECPRCGHIWYPNPNKWRNVNDILNNSKKLLHCPICNKLVILSEYMTYAVVAICKDKKPMTRREFEKTKVRSRGKKRTHNLRDS